MSGIRVELELDDGSFTTRMIHAGETVAAFNRNVGQTYVSINKLSDSHRDLLGTLRDVSVLFGTAGAALSNIRAITTGWIGDIVKTNAELQKTHTLLKGMSKAADPVADAAEQMKALRGFSENAPYSLQLITKTFVQLKAAGIDPLKGSLSGLMDAVSAMGGSGEVMGRAALAMGQMSGKGVIQMEELRQQLGEAVPRAAELMARSMGVSYAELVKAIATGTVEAKPALELLRQEFDRTFGGAAKANMETYDGLISRIGTSYTKLQAIAGGVSEGGAIQKGGFFDEVQNQLKDLLALMQSAQAQDFAKGLGESLTSALLAIRSAIDTVSRFKDEIVDLGKAILIAFAVSRSISALQALGTAIAGVGTQITMARAQWTASMAALAGTVGPAAASTQAMAAWQVQMAASTTTGISFATSARIAAASMLGISPVAAQGTTLMQRLAASTNIVGTATRFAAIGFATLQAAMGFIAGWLPLLVTGVMLAGEKWGWFKDRAKEAREELTKFGATGEQQVKDAFDATIAQKDNELKALDKVIAYNRRHFTGPLSAGINTINDNERDARAKELNDLQVERDRQLGLARDAQQKKQTDAEMAELSRAQTLRQSVYDRQLTTLEGYYKDEREKLIRARQSTQALDQSYREVVLERQRQLYTDKLNADQDYADRQLAIAMGADKTAAAQAERNLSAVRARLIETRRELDAFEEANKGRDGIPTLQRAANEKKAIEKLEQQITNVKAKSEGLRAEMAGAASDAARVVFELENSNKIPQDNPAIQALIAGLKEALEIHDRLEKALKARQALDRDIESAAKKAMEERFELEYGHLTDFEKIEQKAKLGLYGEMTGQTRSAQTAVDALSAAQTGMNGKMEAGKRALDGLDTALKNAFGMDSVTALEKAAGVMREMTGSVERLRTLSDGLDLSKGFSGLDTNGGALKLSGRFGLDGVGTAVTGASGRDVELMIRTVIAEARGEGNDGMQAVAEVIRNRSQVSGRSLSQVVTDPKQFSPWNTPASIDRLMSVPADSEIYQRAAKIVEGVLNGTAQSLIGNRTSFANPGASDKVNREGWIASMQDKLQLGNHVFGNAGYGGRAIDRDVSNLRGADADRVLEGKIAEARNTATKARQSFEELMGTYSSDAEEFGKDQAALGSRVKALRKQVEAKDGKLNPNGMNGGWDDPYWDELKKKAEAADAAEKKAHENEALRRKAATARDAMGQSRQDIEEQNERARRQLADPYSFKSSDAYLAKERGLRRQAEARVAGGDDEATVMAEKVAQLNSFTEQEIALKASGFMRENRLLEQSLMTQGQSRSQALLDQVRQLDGYLVAYEQAGGKEVAVTNAIEERKRLLRQAAAQASPLGRQFQEWSDWGNQMEKATSGWMSSFSDQFAEMVTTGKGDFASLTQSIIKDIIKMGIQWTMSSMFKSFFGFGGLGGGGDSPTGGVSLFGSAGGWLSGLFGAAHVGGVIGNTTMSRAVSPMAFAGAPRFHTGGVIGALSPSMGIKRGEVPIVGLEGEGVFTQEQMKALGGLARQGDSQVISIAPTINLTASGGTPDQNADLAARVSQQLEGGMRALVCDELRKQTRPNGLLNR